MPRSLLSEIGMKTENFHPENRLKELNETIIWLRILQGSIAVNPDFLSRLIAENTELCKILVASVQTARRNDLKTED